MERKSNSPFLPKSWDLPQAIRRRLGDDAGRQRLMDEEGHLLLILHEPPTPEDEEVRKPVLIWIQPDGARPRATNPPAAGPHWMNIWPTTARQSMTSTTRWTRPPRHAPLSMW